MLEILGENTHWCWANRERERNFQYTEHGKEPLENSNELSGDLRINCIYAKSTS